LSQTLNSGNGVAIEVHGFCEPRFQLLKEAFLKNFEDGLEVGASFAVTHKGKFVVDLWAGHADFARTRAWKKDTIVSVASTTKIAMIYSFLILVDRGRIDLDATVATYWPEFAAGGKERVTVRQAMTHCAGVPGFDPPIDWMTLFDWDAIAANIAAEKHWFAGEARFCYHPTTYGFLLGEIMRRVDGRRPAQFFREEIAQKIGADFRIDMHLAAELRRWGEMNSLKPPGTLISASPLYARVFGTVGPQPPWRNWADRTYESPAASGNGNARSIARLCAIGAMGGTLDGVRLLSKAMVDEASKQQVVVQDEYLGGVRMGLGFGLDSEWFPAPTPTCFHWGGYGGSWGIMDQKTAISAGYAMNNMIVEDGPDEIDVRRARFFDALKVTMGGIGGTAC